ncbi:MAG TPA: energy transducer TonB [Dongiaceae bacterium]|nr:energy transducer TonB [Dongiaceae bacterium]
MTPYSQHVGSKQNEPPFKTHATGGSLGAGVLLSVGLHAVLVGFIIFGLPIFWQPEQLPGAIGIEMAQLSDITAAPVPQVQGKPKEQPTPEPPKPAPPVEEKPKAEAPPPPPAPAAAPPPPPPPEPEEEVAEAIPDPAAEKKKEEEKKKAEEKKKKEEEKKKKEAEKKKKEEEKKKQQKADDEALAKLLLDVSKQKAAPEPEQKPEKKQVAAAEAEPVTGELTENASPVRLTAAQEDGYRRQLIPNWNFDAGIANPENYVVTVRIDLAPDGTVLNAEILDKSRMSDPVFRSVAETAKRAPLSLGRFEIPPGEQVPPQIDIVFDLAKAINGSF